MIDIEQPASLLQYLRDTGRIPQQEAARIQVLSGGVSNRTVLFQRANGEGWVLKQALEKLRVKDDWFCDPSRIRREAAGARCLAQICPAGTITPIVFEDPTQNLFAMHAVPQPHFNFKSVLLEGMLPFAQLENYADQFGSLLGMIHVRSGHDKQLAHAFADRSFFEALRIEPYYLATAQRVPEAASFLHRLVQDTRRHTFTLVHGDYTPKNILIYQDRLVLLDHEVIHFGDGAFDCGLALAHLLSKSYFVRNGAEDYRQMTLRFWQSYLRQIQTEPWSEHAIEAAIGHTLGCLLARVAGKSKLDYYSDSDRQRQRDAVVMLILHPPQTIPLLVDQLMEMMRR